ncbi:carbon-nitrogen family hydrolase [Streptomyces bambusae]|uniref:carbon-nitrogen family hydrolase n=1 Tax=Streptomyces bambusae TaxID=1550616 RepID=UPI001CFF4CF8|nr:carbon-nitrogen family hydrolase [Streptomyces bambusae]MCB5163414.1 carbon-nitrogen family hydrolase [Streptomyces bambusae]
MRASLIQIAVNEGESVESRRFRAADLVRAQGDAELVLLPELWPVGAFDYEEFGAAAEPVEGPTYAVMAEAAREAGVWLHAGSIVERDADGTLYNTTLVFAPDGALAASYRKIHRFGFDRGEAVMMGRGDELRTVSVPSFVLGLSTCYDLRFPELYRGLVDRGATALVVSAGWPERRRGHWTLLARARAVENQAYVLAVGGAGTHAGVEMAGHSLVVDPWGEVLGEAGPSEQVLTVDLDPGLVARTRADFPALKDRLLGLIPPA